MFRIIWPISIVSDDFRQHRVILAIAVAVLFAAVPQIASSQEAECALDVTNAPELVTLADADVSHVRLEISVDPAHPPATGRAVLTLQTDVVDADSIRLLTGGAAIDEVISQDLGEALPYRLLSRDTILVDLGMLRDSLIVQRDSLTLALALGSIPGVQISQGFAWTIDPLLTGGAWYPWSGDPADRFTFELQVTVPDEILVGASGRRLAERETEDGDVTYLYAASEPHDARSLIFAAGPFVDGQSFGKVDFFHPGSLDAAPELVAAEALASLERDLDTPFPYERLAVYVVPGIAPPVPGAGILLLSETTEAALGSPRAVTAAADIAEGVARQWLGSMVSPESWADLWLSAGLGAYLGTLAVDHPDEEPGLGLPMRMLANAYHTEAGRYRRALTSTSAYHPIDLNDAHARGKGAWAAHILRRDLGPEEFRNVLGGVLAQNAFASASTVDLARTAEEFGARLGATVDRWVRAAGHPELASSYTSVRDTLFITIEQQQTGPGVPEVYDMRLEVEVGTLGGSENFDIHLDDLRTTFGLPFTSEARFVAIDPRAHYLIEVAMEQPLSAWIAQLRNASTPHARLAAARAVARRRGDPAVVIGLRSALSQEGDPFVKAEILRVIGELSESDAARRAIVSAYEDTSAVVRAAALEALASSGAIEDVERLALEAANDDPENAVQAAAVELLGRIESGRAPEVAQAALITPSRNDVIRRAGLRVLGMLASDGGAATLEAAATYVGPEQPLVVRLDAVDLLERLSGSVRRAENLLLGLRDAPEWELRVAASRALLGAGNQDAVLSHLENEPLSSVRLRLSRLLGCR